MGIELTLVVSAFIAGLLMFLAPCTLPLVPAYLAFISGVTEKDVRDGAPRARRQIFINALGFVLGFSLIFILFGILAGLFASFIGAFRPLMMQIGGVFIIFFGLLMLGWIPFLKLSGGGSLPIPSYLKPGNPFSAFLIGATFALGWTPCVGPVLATVLLLATTTTTMFEGAILLTIFSLGLAIPFLLTALLYARAGAIINQSTWLVSSIRIVGALFLILVGVLLLSDNFGLTVQYGYILFEFLGIEGLFDHF